MKRPQKNLIFKKQDLELFSYLHSVKIATYEQIWRDIYPEHALQSVRNRVLRMVKEKWVAGSFSPYKGQHLKVYHLTRKGFMEFVANQMETRHELISDAPEHDLDLVDIRYRFLTLEATQEYYTENQIQTWGRSALNSEIGLYVNLNSDAIVVLKIKNVELKVPIEVENHHKADRLYQRLLQRYYQSSAVDIVFFVARSKAVLNKMMELERKLYASKQPRFFYALNQGLLESEALVLKNCNGFSLELRELPVS